MKKPTTPTKKSFKNVVTDIPSFDLGVLTPKSPPKIPASPHASAKSPVLSSPRQVRAEMRSKHLHDVDASSIDKPVQKKLKRKGKEMMADDDFVDESPKVSKVKKAKLSPSSSKQKMKKPAKQAKKSVPQKISFKNGPYYAQHHIDYGVQRFHTLCEPSIPSQINALLSPNQLRVFKKTCFGYLLGMPPIQMQNQTLHLLMKYELSKSAEAYFSVLLKGEKLFFSLREFALITGFNCVSSFSDFGYQPDYVSRLQNTYFGAKDRVEKSQLKNIVTNRAWENDLDVVQLCVLYLLEFFVCPSDKDHVTLIDKFVFFLVESGHFESYPWGTKSFNQVIESVRHRLSPSVHSYLMRGCSLALQVWLYECCSSVSTEIATRCSDSIPRILRWSASKGQIWLTAIEDKMIKPEWLKYSNMVEAGEEVGALNLPEKIHYEDVDVDQPSTVPTAASPSVEPNQSNSQNVMESVNGKLIQLEKRLDQVDANVDGFKKDVVKELSNLREFIDQSLKSVMNAVNKRFELDDSKFAGSSTKQNDPNQGDKNTHFQFTVGDHQYASTSNTAPTSPQHVQPKVDLYSEFQEAADAFKADQYSPELAQANVDDEPTHQEGSGVEKAIVDDEPTNQEGSELEKEDVEDNVPLSPIHGVSTTEAVEEEIKKEEVTAVPQEATDIEEQTEVVPEGRENKAVTLEDFDLPDNLTQLVVFEDPIPDEETPVHPGRTRKPGKHARSPFTPLYSTEGSTSAGPKYFYLKHPFTSNIGEDVDQDLIARFTEWLYHRTDNGNRRKKEYYSKKDNQLNPELDFGYMKIDKKDWFYALSHPGQVITSSHIDVIMYYLRKKGKYGPNIKTRFTTTDCLFKTKIERIYEKWISSPPDRRNSVVKADDDIGEYILGYMILANVPWDLVDYVIMPVNLVENFHWLLLVFDIKDRQLYVYDSLVRANQNQTVRAMVDKFSIMIPLYLSCTGFYGKRNDIDFKSTKSYIEKPVTDPLEIQWLVAEIPQQKEGSLDCGVFVAAFAEYVSCGDLAIPKEDLTDIVPHRIRFGALLWDYATKKLEDGSISESEVTGRLARRKGAPAKNERTKVLRKKK